MSYYLCLIIDHAQADEAASVMAPLQLEDITSTPLANKLTAGRSKRIMFVSLTSTATEVLDKGYRRSHSSGLFINGVERLLGKCPAVSFVILFFGGDPEAAPDLGDLPRKKLSLDEFRTQFPRLDENTRYIVLAPRALANKAASHP
jgi:hypothetical protein